MLIFIDSFKLCVVNKANIEIVDPNPVNLNLDNVKYHKMTASQYIDI